MTNSSRFGRAYVLISILTLSSLLLTIPATSAHSGLVLRGFASAPPAIDGVIGAGEWASADTHSFLMTGDGGTPYSVTIFEMNDLTNLYLAVRISDDEIAPSNTDRVGFNFDNDHGGEGALEVGDDRIQCLVEGLGVEAEDRFWDNGFFTDDGAPDNAQQNFACGATDVGANIDFELSHPLCVGGNGDLANGRVHDICLTPGGTVGFMFNYRDAVGAGGSPEFGSEPSQPSGTYNPAIFHEIRALSGPPDFSIGASVPAISVAQGSSGMATIAVISLNSFSSSVALSGSWVGSAPADVTFNLPSPITPPSGGIAGSPLTVNAGSSASLGGFILRVTGLSGSLTHSVDVTVNITPTTLTTTTGATTTTGTITTTTTGGTVVPDFSIASAPTAITVMQGSSASATIVVTSINGFSSAVALSGSWVGTAPSGVIFNIPSPITPPATSTASSTLTVSADTAASIGSFMLRVTGTGSATHIVDVGIQIIAATTGGRCLIATATFGSELSPEVQFLRNFRDNFIMKTNAGSNFMIAFNAWYYSFSPHVATYLSEHWVERNLVKGGLYPLVGILLISSWAFSFDASYPELGALVSGLIASSLMGGVYIGLPAALLRAGSRRLRYWRAEKIFCGFLGSALLLGLVGTLLAELFSISALMILSTSTVVLSSLLLSATATAIKVAKKLQPLLIWPAR